MDITILKLSYDHGDLKPDFKTKAKFEILSIFSCVQNYSQSTRKSNLLSASEYFRS